MEGFCKVAAPMHQFTKLKTTFASKQVHEEAFRRLKPALCSIPILAYLRPYEIFILVTDASKVRIGAVLPHDIILEYIIVQTGITTQLKSEVGSAER